MMRKERGVGAFAKVEAAEEVTAAEERGVGAQVQVEPVEDTDAPERGVSAKMKVEAQERYRRLKITRGDGAQVKVETGKGEVRAQVKAMPTERGDDAQENAIATKSKADRRPSLGLPVHKRRRAIAGERKP